MEIPAMATEQDYDEYLARNAWGFVHFTAVWCKPCVAMVPILEEAADAYAGRITFCKVDVQELPAVAARYGCRMLPTGLLFQDGQQRLKLRGARSRLSLFKSLDEALQHPTKGSRIAHRLLGR